MRCIIEIYMYDLTFQYSLEQPTFVNGNLDTAILPVTILYGMSRQVK